MILPEGTTHTTGTTRNDRLLLLESSLIKFAQELPARRAQEAADEQRRREEEDQRRREAVEKEDQRRRKEKELKRFVMMRWPRREEQELKRFVMMRWAAYMHDEEYYLGGRLRCFATVDDRYIAVGFRKFRG